MSSETIHLTGLGLVPAKRAADLRVGDVTLWNYGYRYTILDVWQKSPAFVGVISRCEKSGKEYEQRFRNSRLVGVDPTAENCYVCGESVAPGSGRFVNRVPAEDDQWICAGCICEHNNGWDHHFDPDSRLGDYYTCSACGALTQVG